MKKTQMKNIVNCISLMVAFIAITSIVSCNKSVDGSVVDGSTKRFFTPTNLNISTSKDTATFSWTAPLFPVANMTYTVEIAKDTLFSTIIYSTPPITSTRLLIINLPLNTPLYARVKVNQYKDIAPSHYLSSTKSFRLLGLQYLKAIRDFEITQSSVVLHWYINSATVGATSILLTPSKGTPISVPVNSVEANVGAKTITGINANQRYTIQLFAGTKSLGFTNFVTPAVVNFTTTITAGVDDLAATIAAALDGDVIGLNPGVYTLDTAVQVLNKTITIRSISNNPSDTKILSPELDLVGNGAGLTLAGVEVSGIYTDTAIGNAVIQLYGSPTTNTPSTFTDINIDNCIIHNYKTCIIKGNNALLANDFQINSIVVNNSQLYSIDTSNTSGYYMFALERMHFNSVSFKNSTFFNLGEGLINMGTSLGTLATLPSITINYCTFNNLGGNNKYLLFDANTNAVNYALDNCILANTPIKGSVNAKAFRASASSLLDFSNNNIFKFNSTIGGLNLILTGLGQAGNITDDLGWTPATTGFSLSSQPASDAIFTASSNGGTIGDGRWAY